MQNGHLHIQSSEIAYHQFGNGQKLLICFHGFGDHAGMFDILQPALAEKYTVYAISLPFHGKTMWGKEIFTREDIALILQHICKKEGMESFSLLGYSMGGKIALNMAPYFPQQLEKLILLAPDGINTHKLYDIHALPKWVISMVKFLLTKPALFFQAAKFGHKSGLLTKFIYEFTINHFSTDQQRQRFFSVYSSIKDFQPDLAQVKKVLNENKITSEVYLGERDEIIPPTTGAVFAKGLKDCKVSILPKGHLLVDADLNSAMAESGLNTFHTNPFKSSPQ